MGTNQSSLASKNTTVENKSTLSTLFSGKRGRKESQTSSDDLVIVEKPVVESNSAVGSITDEGSDSESDDEYGTLIQLTISSFVDHLISHFLIFICQNERRGVGIISQRTRIDSQGRKSPETIGF